MDEAQANEVVLAAAKRLQYLRGLERLSLTLRDQRDELQALLYTALHDLAIEVGQEPLVFRRRWLNRHSGAAAVTARSLEIWNDPTTRKPPSQAASGVINKGAAASREGRADHADA